ncbi:MAG: lamin tail domain-containing protein [Flavobacteriales bacterium]|nr:lamin tail domain-containing protein [Flavobacteriales bacterium]
MSNLLRLSFLVLSTYCSIAAVSAQFSDDFTDGDITMAPVWSGNTVLFTVADDAGNNRLRSNSAGASTYALTTPSTIATNARWEWFADLRFATSGANYAEVYLISDNADISLAQNGWFVRMGGTADVIELFKRVAGVNTSVLVSPAGVVNSSSSNPFKIRVERTTTNEWTLFFDDGNTGIFASVGPLTDAAVATSSHFGVAIVQSTLAGAVNGHFFDDFVVDVIPFDNAPPAITAVTVLDATHIDVVFDEAVELSSANTAGNYSTLPVIGVTTAMRDAVQFSTVQLTLATTMTSGTNYTLTVQNVADLVGNAITTATFPFSYFVPAAPEFRDVVINEIMADPNPTVGLPAVEWVELYNATTDQSFDLAGWTFSDGGTPVVMPSYTLMPGAYVVLMANASLPLFPALMNKVGVASLPALNDGGDALVITDDLALTIDAVTYTSSWYQDAVKAAGGWTLEQIDPTNPCSGASNWRASNAIAGGTPGSENSIFAVIPDTQPPTISNVQVVSSNTLNVLFSEAMDAASIPMGSYTIQPTLNVVSVVASGTNGASLVLDADLLVGTLYTLTVTGVADCPGNVIGAGNNAQFALPVPAEFRNVVINEIMADPNPTVGLPVVEWVELYNATTDQSFDLAGWTFSDGGTPVVMPTYTLLPGAYVVVMASASLPLFPALMNKVGLASLPALNDGGDALVITDNLSMTIDAVTYTSNWYQNTVKADGGWTLEQIDPTSPCSGASNWRASNATAGGTPGSQNSIYAIVPDTQPPVLVSVEVVSPTTITVLFNETMDASSLVGANYFITPTIATGDVFPNYNNGANVELLQPMELGIVYTLVVEDASDCTGNLITTGNTAQFALPDSVEVGDVVINEVLYDPYVGGVDFVELYNRSQKTLSLTGWKMANVTSGAIASPVAINSGMLLLPGQFVVITSSTANIASLYPQSHTERFVENALPGYNNDEGSVVLQGPDGSTLDRFDYNDDLHFTLVNNPEGYSLERVDPDRATDDNTNWQTAADIAGKATPGFVNSQYSKTKNASGDMTIEPAIFSPDNDGHQDLLTIGYRFQEPGFVGNMIVYDVVGREVKKLMENQLLGTEGAISWNGIMDSGSLGRIGPYIVVLEVYDLAGNVDKFKKTVTLAHRL